LVKDRSGQSLVTPARAGGTVIEGTVMRFRRFACRAVDPGTRPRDEQDGRGFPTHED